MPLHRLPTLRLVVGICLAWLYLVAATPVTPALTALLAAADRSHQVTVRQTQHGVAVVLRHQARNSRLHRHGLLARVLTTIAERPAGSQADHVIQFAGGTASVQLTVLAVEASPETPAPELFSAGDLLPEEVPWVILSVAAHPPPAASGSLLGIRSTVILV